MQEFEFFTPVFKALKFCTKAKIQQKKSV